ncbi:uncharacterized protein LOC108815178 isoform X2 [Raphanus sativus]|uniref:Uncharacterized protein LOC108815178 isoform X2 n=1 Tax=Raphanus sativus TaxID=3726 RepID=A0A9W3C4E7_RAPSA|nr:uncharacterized protein LOC108815178 isoform X2 [Raphanus sativus]
MCFVYDIAKVCDLTLSKMNRYVTGDDDSLFFVDNLVDVLSKYDHTRQHYIGINSETIKSNVYFDFNMGFGGGGYALSYALVEALVVDLYGDISGFLSSHPTAPLVSLHHFDTVTPLFPGMDRPGSVIHIMQAANVDQSRMLQQSICHFRASNWTFSVSWGYTVHIYENIFPRSHLKLPIETFRPWYGGRPPFYMFNTRPVSRDPCEAPHWFFFDSIEQVSGGVVTSYTRKFIRNMTSCSFSGNISADPLASIQVFSPKTPRQGREVECCDVKYEGDAASIRLRDCRRDEIIA